MIGFKANQDKLVFHLFFSYKDILGAFLMFFFFFFFILSFPVFLGDTENFIAANPIVTPIHIQPE
jgi:ubiquinol-cytochrome c reductase cytochrome b subunit